MSALPDYAWSSSQLVGLLVAASVAEQKSADHRGVWLRFVPRGSQATDRADWRTRRRRRCRVLHQGSDCVNPSAGKAIARKAMSGSAKAMSVSPVWRTSKRG
jgi:hypothetical protein